MLRFLAYAVLLHSTVVGWGHTDITNMAKPEYTNGPNDLPATKGGIEVDQKKDPDSVSDLLPRLYFNDTYYTVPSSINGKPHYMIGRKISLFDKLIAFARVKANGLSEKKVVKDVAFNKLPLGISCIQVKDLLNIKEVEREEGDTGEDEYGKVTFPDKCLWSKNITITFIAPPKVAIDYFVKIYGF